MYLYSRVFLLPRLFLSSEILEEQNMMPPSSENPDPDGQMQDGHVNKGSDITEKKVNPT